MIQLHLKSIVQWVLLLLLNQVLADPLRSECERTGIFSKKQKGHSLQNHIIQTLQVTEAIDCTIACVGHSSCRSYNIEEKKESPKTCELSDSTKTASSGDFVSRPGFSYYDAGDEQQLGPGCQSSPCLNGGKCIETCSAPGYQCECDETLHQVQPKCRTLFPDSCQKLKDLGLSKGDGEYYLYLQLPTCPIPARVYCADMNSDTPTEYVTLPAGRDKNYAFDNRKPGTYNWNHGKTAFDKIRLKLPEREVQTDDWRFSTLVEGDVNQKYGTARACRTSNCASTYKIGETKADLTGTDFKFPPTMPYVIKSWPSCNKVLAYPSMSSDQKRWYTRCGGYCGGCDLTSLILSVDGC